MKLIRENAITDFRRELQGVDLGGLEDKKAVDYYSSKYYVGSSKRYRGEPKYSEQSIKSKLVGWVEDKLSRDFDFNTEDLNLVRVAKPKGPNVAKRNPNLLIGISTQTGDAVVIGDDKFHRFFSGTMGRGSRRYDDDRAPKNPEPDYQYKERQVSLRDLWESLDLWFEVIKQDDYTPRSEINKGRNKDRIGTYDRIIGDDETTDHNRDMRRNIFWSEAELYDPDRARERYTQKLKHIHTRREYEDVLDSIDSINDRIRSIDFGHPILGGGTKYSDESVRRLRNAYANFKYEIEHLNKEIDDGNDWGINYHGKSARKTIEQINSILADDFGV